MLTNSQLLEKKCAPTKVALTDAEIAAYLPAITGWQRDGQRIVKVFDFKNYYETLAFINAIAYVVHAEDHHPELTVTYNHCRIAFDTHSVNDGKGGLSENDFICAAKVDAIFQQSFARA
ncbi:MAG: 4a-hydroxytetrahydrobiopterin dehydratase [Herminiimonas sp.]|nr:4a-hydroxytetrahydrobiopterin dehydratase [Herminiimonas sp.]